MANELERWANAGSRLIRSRLERNQKRAVDKLVQETKLTGLQIDAEAVLARRIMKRVVELDGYREELADGDPVLDAVLAHVEVGFADKASRIQRQFGSEFPL